MDFFYYMLGRRGKESEFSFALGDEGWGRRVTHLSITLYSIFTCQVVTA